MAECILVRTEFLVITTELDILWLKRLI